MDADQTAKQPDPEFYRLIITREYVTEGGQPMALDISRAAHVQTTDEAIALLSVLTQEYSRVRGLVAELLRAEASIDVVLEAAAAVMDTPEAKARADEFDSGQWTPDMDDAGEVFAVHRCGERMRVLEAFLGDHQATCTWQPADEPAATS